MFITQNIPNWIVRLWSFFMISTGLEWFHLTESNVIPLSKSFLFEKKSLFKTSVVRFRIACSRQTCTKHFLRARSSTQKSLIWISDVCRIYSTNIAVSKRILLICWSSNYLHQHRHCRCVQPKSERFTSCTTFLPFVAATVVLSVWSSICWLFHWSLVRSVIFSVFDRFSSSFLFVSQLKTKKRTGICSGAFFSFFFQLLVSRLVLVAADTLTVRLRLWFCANFCHFVRPVTARWSIAKPLIQHPNLWLTLLKEIHNKRRYLTEEDENI